MSRFSLLLVSDSHLSPRRPFFNDNWAPVVAASRQLAPDLVIQLGDASLNGADEEEDLRFARARHDELAVPWRAVPGNHDIGDNPVEPGRRLRQPIDAERRARWQAIFGDAIWIEERGDWLLAGLDAQWLCSDLADWSDQVDFLRDAVSRAGGRPLALFLHKPPFQTRPGGPGAVRRILTETGRRRLDAGLSGGNLKLVANGHVHQRRHFRLNGVDHVWAPSSAFVMPDAMQKRLGEKAVGLVRLDFEGERVAVRPCRPAGMTDFDLFDFPEAYGDIKGYLERKRAEAAAAEQDEDDLESDAAAD